MLSEFLESVKSIYCESSGNTFIIILELFFTAFNVEYFYVLQLSFYKILDIIIAFILSANHDLD